MQKITIKKESEEIVNIRKSEEIVFTVNGKKVRVHTYSDSGDDMNMPESDTNISETDIKNLTDIEYEVFGENLQDWLDLKQGESKVEEAECNDPTCVNFNNTMEGVCDNCK